MWKEPLLKILFEALGTHLVMVFLEELLTFIGHFHPLLVHLPIGMLVLAFAMAVASKWNKNKAYNSAIRFSLALATIASVIAGITGYLLSRHGGYETDVLAYHQWLGIGVGVFSFLSLGLYREAAFLSPWKVKLQKQRFLFLCSAVFLLTLTGHYGGTLTHGKGYIRDALPAAIKELLPVASPDEQAIVFENVQEAQLYEEIIQPILIQRCQSCHGAKKQEGGLALHTKSDLLKGGEGGSVVAGGDLIHSELYARLILPEGDEKRMPPKGRKPISADQINLIGWWIAEGARFDKRVADIPQGEEIQALLAKLEAGNADPALPEYAELPAAKALPADLVQQLQAKGIKVLPIATNNNYVAINAINYPELTDDDLKALLALKDHIVQLKLGHTQVTDIGLQHIAALPFLKRLHLEHTQITDQGINQLTTLTRLVYLNLVGTKVTDKGVEALSGMPTLTHLYTYQTAVQQVQGLQSTTLNVDTGNYTLPFLKSDTTKY